MLRRQTNEEWTDKHLNVLRKLVVEEGWVQKRMYDIGWSDEYKWRGCDKEEGREKHSLYYCPSRREARYRPQRDWRYVTKEQKSRRKTAYGKEV